MFLELSDEYDMDAGNMQDLTVAYGVFEPVTLSFNSQKERREVSRSVLQYGDRTIFWMLDGTYVLEEVLDCECRYYQASTIVELFSGL